ncbi:MAG TPA: tRNA(His) guanylyltransferase Thg1 family protein [Oculatellaceae cyanobacterium]
MRFSELDNRMRVYEEHEDRCVLPGIFMVARIDGRNFTRLTKEVHKFKSPFDERVRDMMVETTEHLMNCGFNVLFGYTQSDEISLLFHYEENAFERKVRKYNSILAGEASAKFSLLLKDLACFDCRLCELPNESLVVDYFRWRNEDAHRNALSAHCYWLLRQQGRSASDAAAQLERCSTAQKNELLFQHGINFNELPHWQKRGSGLYWEKFEKQGINPKTGQIETALRRRIKRDLELPMRDEFSSFVRGFLSKS